MEAGWLGDARPRTSVAEPVIHERNIVPGHEHQLSARVELVDALAGLRPMIGGRKRDGLCRRTIETDGLERFECLLEIGSSRIAMAGHDCGAHPHLPEQCRGVAL